MVGISLVNQSFKIWFFFNIEQDIFFAFLLSEKRAGGRYDRGRLQECAI